MAEFPYLGVNRPNLLVGHTEELPPAAGGDEPDSHFRPEACPTPARRVLICSTCPHIRAGIRQPLTLSAAAGAVRHYPSASDERVVEIDLTKAGRTLHRQCACVPVELMKSTPFPLDKLLTLKGLLDELIVSLGDAGDQPEDSSPDSD